MNTDLKELRKLLYKATNLPWTEQCLGGRELGDAGLMENLESVSSPFSRSSHADDLAFAVAAINSLPALLSIAEAAHRVSLYDWSNGIDADADADMHALHDSVAALSKKTK